MSASGASGIDRRALFTRYGKKPSFGPTEIAIRWTLRSLAYLTVFVTISIVFVLVIDAVNFFAEVSFGHFLAFSISDLGSSDPEIMKWEPFGGQTLADKSLNVWPLMSGTLMVAFGAILVAVPLGLGTAVYLTQYASPKVANIISPIVEILGGIPTVVYGYFALTAVTPFFRNYIFNPDDVGIFNALSASIIVGIAILPMISSLSAEALRLVPAAIRNAGYALGMRKFHVVTKIMIPAAFSGIVASVLLAFARAVGETMAVTLAAGATPNIDLNYLQGIQTMTAFIVQISLGDTPAGTIEYYTIYALGLALFLMTFMFNILASQIVKRFREAYQ